MRKQIRLRAKIILKIKINHGKQDQPQKTTSKEREKETLRPNNGGTEEARKTGLGPSNC